MKKFKIYDKITEHVVREVFFAISEDLGFTILSSRTEFPDYILLKEDKVFRAEVEVSASNFYSHKHPENEYDMIICYKNDLKNTSPLEVVEFEDFIEIVRDSRENEIVTRIRGISLETEKTKSIQVPYKIHEELLAIKSLLVKQLRTDFKIMTTITFPEVLIFLVVLYKELLGDKERNSEKYELILIHFVRNYRNKSKLKNFTPEKTRPINTFPELRENLMEIQLWLVRQLRKKYGIVTSVTYPEVILFLLLLNGAFKKEIEEKPDRFKRVMDEFIKKTGKK